MKRRDFLAASAGLAGSVLPVLSRAQTRPCPPSPVSVDGGQGSTTVCIQGDAEADWQERISGAGVVWFHDFRTDDEVNNFRWTPGYGNGNDPLAVGSAYAKYVRRITTDGITGGGCLEIFQRQHQAQCRRRAGAGQLRRCAVGGGQRLGQLRIEGRHGAAHGDG